ncbi:MAG TPA: ABC transporter substrate-binding protein [Longimicrobium sp.]|uniref:ABC transporter substrate-binding protein n=1 Tax=Longimicrobium sp. TaxID=2029185 RepID=UPI002ED9DC66
MRWNLGGRRGASAAWMLALSIALAACGGGGDQKGGAPRAGGAGDEGVGAGHPTFTGAAPGGTMIFLAEGDADDLNPLTFDNTQSYQIVHLLFRALARRDSTLSNYTPDLLQSWERPDSATLILKVRPNLKWHDGRPVTADDVVFTIQRQQDSATASPRQADVGAVTSVRAVDPQTVEVKLNRTGPSTVNALLEVIPVPKHLLENVDPAQMRFNAFSQKPVGNGLFRFGSWTKGQQIMVEANPDAPEGRPALDRIVVRVVPDATARLTQLLNGEGDAMKVAPEQREQLANARGVRLETAAQVRPGWIAFNQQKAPVNDPAVRRAFLMAINREQIVQAQFGEQGTAALSPIAPGLREHSADVRPIPSDPNGAKQLLEQAGWRDTNGDGIREKNGQPLRIVVEVSSSDQMRKDMLIFMQQQLRQAGIDLSISEMERASWVERLRGRQFTASFWGWGWGPGVMGPNAEMLFHSRSIPPNGANFAGYSNPRADALIDSILVENDSTRARGMWKQLEQQVIDDAVYAPIFLDPEFYAVNQRFANVKFRGPEWWEDAIYWSIPENRRLPRDRAR